MKVSGKRYIQYPSQGMRFNIWNLSDLHVGSKACALDEIEKDVKIIAEDPCAYWLGGGDYADFIGYRDGRFDPDTIAEYIKVKDLGKLGKKLTDDVIEILKPIKHKCLGLLYGNHEKKYELWTEQQDLHHYMCVTLEVPDLGYSALFDLVFERKSCEAPFLKKSLDSDYGSCDTFRFFVHHGAGFAATKAGKLKRLLDFMTYFQADVFMLGHVHDQEGARVIQIGANPACTKLVQHHSIGIISGSYLKTYHTDATTYGEQRGYAPTVLGAAKVILKPGEANPKERMKGEI